MESIRSEWEIQEMVEDLEESLKLRGLSDVPPHDRSIAIYVLNWVLNKRRNLFW